MAFPLRFAVIRGSEIHGSTVSTRYELKQFAYSPEPERLNDVVHEVNAPVWIAPDDVKGWYWSTCWAWEVDEKDAVVKRVTPGDLRTWEAIIHQLAQSPEFRDQEVFYTVDEIKMLASGARNSGMAVTMRDGRLRLRPRREYSLRLYHFSAKNESPDRPFAGQRFHFRTGASWLQLVSNPDLPVDSPYDRKELRFRTGSPTDTVYDRISILRSTEPGQSEPRLDFDLEVSVRSDRVRLMFYGVLVGIALWVPQLITMLRINDFPNVHFWAGVALVSYVVAGLIGALGIKKVV